MPLRPTRLYWCLEQGPSAAGKKVLWEHSHPECLTSKMRRNWGVLSFGALLFPHARFLAVARASATRGGCWSDQSSGFESAAIGASLDLSLQPHGSMFLCCNKKTQPTPLLRLGSRDIRCIHACLDGNMYVSHLCAQRDCLSLECSLSVLELLQPSQAPGHNY